MTPILIVLLLAYASIVLSWLMGWVCLQWLQADQQMSLVAMPNRPASQNDPSLGVYIAAHNEESRIEACLDRLLAQNYGNMRITVVNDRSRDATADRVRAVMAREPRVTLVEIWELPPGWIGKTHALAVAAGEAKEDYLLFIDSDCRLESGAIAAVIDKAERENVEFLTLWPRLELLSASERFMTPPTAWLLGLWAIVSARFRNLTADVRLGNGQFLMTSRSAYERLGGHASVRAELAEDAILASKAANLNLRRWAGLGAGLYVTSRDNSWGTTVNALVRVTIGSLVSPWRVLWSTQLVLGGCVTPVWIAPLGAYFGLTAESTEGAIWGWIFAATACIHYVLMCGTLNRVFEMTLVKRGSVLHFPLGALAYAAVLLRSFWVMIGRGSVRWGASRYTVRGSRIEQVIVARN